MGVSAILKVLSDENRLRILNIIKNDELCVGEISTLLEISRSNASKHLDKLRMADFIKSRKDAQWIYYTLKDDLIEKHSFVKSLLFDEIQKETLFNVDLAKLETYRESGLNCQNLRDVGFDFGQIEEMARNGAS